MNVQVNLKTASARIKGFLETHGGSATHSEVLELVAGVCGFNSYRAMKSTAEKATNVGPAVAPTRANAVKTKYEERLLENPDRVVLKATAVDWRLADHPSIGFDMLPAEKRERYDVIVEHCGDQFRVLMKPVGANLDTFDGKPVLDMLLEVNEGVPCVHLTNDPADALLLSVFATEKGLLVRPDDGEWVRADSSRVPSEIVELAKTVASEGEKAYVCLLDTAAKYQGC